MTSANTGSTLSAAKAALAKKAQLKAKGTGMVVTIQIGGPSADNLFPVGPIDIRDHFLAHGFGNTDFNPKDVKSIKFTKRAIRQYSRVVRKPAHKDNF